MFPRRRCGLISFCINVVYLTAHIYLYLFTNTHTNTHTHTHTHTHAVCDRRSCECCCGICEIADQTWASGKLGKFMQTNNEVLYNLVLRVRASLENVFSLSPFRCIFFITVSPVSLSPPKKTEPAERNERDSASCRGGMWIDRKKIDGWRETKKICRVFKLWSAYTSSVSANLQVIVTASLCPVLSLSLSEYLAVAFWNRSSNVSTNVWRRKKKSCNLTRQEKTLKDESPSIRT